MERAARIDQTQGRTSALNQPVEPEGVPGKNQAARLMDHWKLQSKFPSD